MTSMTELLPGWHPYLSTYCLHGNHDQCGAAQASRGEEGAPHCKCCPQVCLCPVCRHTPTAGPRPRGVYSLYRSLRVQRLHVIRDAWMFTPDPARDRLRPRAGSQTLCGQHANGTIKAPATVLDPLPLTPPDGLTWCPLCLGHLAEWMGLAGFFGMLLASAPSSGSAQHDALGAQLPADR